MFVSISILFLCCFFGKIATESYEKISLCSYEADWQELPANLQEHFIIMIGSAQQPLYSNGFGLVVVNLETFAQVNGCFACSKKIILSFVELYF